jgi:hypothetical protein
MYSCPIGTYSETKGTNGSCTPCGGIGYTTSSVATTSSLACTVCMAGYYGLSGSSCTPCDIGTYQSDRNNLASCSPCGLNTYANTTTNIACTSCPISRPITISIGSTSNQDCTCPAGFYFSSSTNTCLQCSLGRYKSTQGPIACTMCPQNQTTLIEGASSISDCECNNGYSSSMGGTCLACPRGSWRGSIGTRGSQCIQCGDFTTTESIAAVTVDQ